VDVNDTFLCCQAAAKVMVKQGYGRIINIASIVSHERIPSMSMAVYRQLLNACKKQEGIEFYGRSKEK
jgi:NAD(P)-dependent dehydrogenase (short-subunit alcohol dehydrogenase family)